MAEFLYRAYLSYSHCDEGWAKWLHRSLESYRVPSALTGQRPDGRVIPERVAPIFRDRDDLPSMANLGDGLEQALRDSESLILICSPAAARSRWVNEEVRYFQSLGRSDKVFCVLVDGDPDIEGGPDYCFPPALFDGLDDGTTEPLAVDPRRYADGKETAKLKLVAGLLGLRLDELRRRELKRRRGRQAYLIAGLMGAAMLAVLAVSARQAEERERQSAEQMASFIVDLGEELKSEIGLEALGLISSRAMSYLENIDPGRLQPETGMKVGLALRQIGQVSDGQGREEDARTAFFQSRDLFAELQESYPEARDLLFELGQAEFYVASHYFFSGRYDLALEPAKRYAQIAQRLFQSNPESPEGKLELSYAATGLLAIQVKGGGPFTDDILWEADRALALAKSIIEIQPDDPDAISNYSDTLAWAADARLLACELEQALSLREETLLMAQKALQKSPSDNQIRESYAYAHSGVGVVKTQLGKLQEATEHFRRSINDLEKLWREDLSNERSKNELQWKRLYLARALLDQGEVDPALGELDRISADVPDIELSQASIVSDALRVEYLLERARAALDRNAKNTVETYLHRAIDVTNGAGVTGSSLDQWVSLVRIYYLWWRAFDGPHVQLADITMQEGKGLRTCQTAITNARIALMSGRPETAAAELAYLASKGYRGRAALQLCEAIGPGSCAQ